MANPKATKTSSGKWRCVVRLKGLPAKSFLGTNKREVEKAALAYKATNGADAVAANRMTVGQAYDKYIKVMTGPLSPSTITGYKRLRKNTFKSLMEIRLDKLSQDDVQLAVNQMIEEGKSPKYIRNAHGLLSAVLSRYEPRLKLNTRLPKSLALKYHIPSEKEIAEISEAVRGTEIEIPVLLAVQCGHRMSEIRGFEWRDISGGRIRVERVIVDTDQGPVEKLIPKTEAGGRETPLTPRLLELLGAPGAPNEKIVKLSASAITGRLDTILRHAEIDHFKFHEFRHSYASVLLAIGVPNKYAANFMGHKTTYMLEKVYQQIMTEFADNYSDQISGYYAKLPAAEEKNPSAF